MGYVQDASSFNQDLSNWNTAKVSADECTEFATGSGCPVEVEPSNEENGGKRTCKAKLENCVIDTPPPTSVDSTH